MNRSSVFKLLKFGFLLLFFIAFLLSSGKSAFAQTKNVTITLKATANGVALQQHEFSSMNFQTAYEKIKDGNFTSQEEKSQYWTSLANNFSTTSSGIQLNSSLVVGEGVTHSQAETLEILQIIYSSGNLNFLQMLNKSTFSGVSFGPQSNKTIFYSPGNETKQYTNADGVTVASIPQGATAIIDESGNSNLLKLFYATQSQTIKIDTINTGSRVSLKLTNVPKSQSDSVSQYTVEYGQELTYQLSVSSSLLQNGANLSLTSSSNLVIDSLSIPSTEQDLIEQNINPNAYISNSGTPAVTSVNSNNATSLANSIGSSLTKQSLYTYSGSLAASSQDVVVTITAHIDPTVSLNRTLALAGESQAVTIPINILSTPSTNLSISASVSGSQGTVACQSPYVNTSGINFAMADTKKMTLVSGAEYVLGKKDNNTYSIYTGSGWEGVNTLSGLNASNYLILKGNTINYIGVGKSAAISWNMNHFDFNSSTDTTLNQSLIQLRGLGAGQYFLYQVQTPTGYVPETQPQFFTIFSQNISTPNGSQITKTSISAASSPSYKLNSEIPDYASDSNEYNVLPMTSGGKVTENPMGHIVLSILIFVGIIGIIGVILFRVVR